MIASVAVTSITLLILGVCLRMSMRLLYGARGPAPEDGVYLLLRIASWGLVIIPSVTLTIVGANWLSLILMIAVGEALIELVLARRAAQRQAVWRLVSGAMGGGRSLVDALRYHQGRFSGIVGRWQRRLLKDLEQGVDWREAVSRNRAAVPREAPAFAAMADRGVRPGPLIADLDDASYAPFQQLQQEMLQRFMYLGTVSLIMLAIIVFVAIKIIPSYEAIFADFDLTLPPFTVWVIAAFGTFGEIIGAPLLILIVLGALAALFVAVLYLCDLPAMQFLTDRVTMSQHRAQVMLLLASGFEQNRPLEHSLMRLSTGRGAYPCGLVRRRLASVLKSVTAGAEWQQSLVRFSLMSQADAGLLRTAQSVGNLPWALRLLAQRKLRRATFRWALVQQIAFVIVILLLGLLVFVFAVAMMIPLYKMIANLAA